jgi:hypothetical protein
MKTQENITESSHQQLVQNTFYNSFLRTMKCFIEIANILNKNQDIWRPCIIIQFK